MMETLKGTLMFLGIMVLILAAVLFVELIVVVARYTIDDWKNQQRQEWWEE